jgi:predicted Zn-dependent protease
VEIIQLFARAQLKSGKSDEAGNLLRRTAERLFTSDPAESAALSVTLGDLYADADRLDDAISAYENAFAARAPAAGTSNPDEREFAASLFEKLIRAYKLADRVDDAIKVIARARLFFGKDDLFADRQLISVYRGSGRKTDALAAVRNVRARFPDDYGFIRLEATVLTEMGKVDEGVSIVKDFLAKKRVTATDPQTADRSSAPQGMSVYDRFSNYLFISNLYSEAGRGKDAAEAANQAYELANGSDRRQIARLTLASAQQQSGDVAGAETTLRELIKQTPGNPIALNNLGYFLLDRSERLEEAIGLIQQALTVDPTNPSYLDSMGWAMFKQGKLSQAERYLKDAARINSESSTISEHLGDVYQKQNKVDLARRAWQRALNLTGDAAEITRLRAKLGLPK